VSPDANRLSRESRLLRRSQRSNGCELSSIGRDQLAGGVEPALIAILSDINMPGMDGLDLLGEIKRRYPELPVMMATAYGEGREPAPRHRIRRRRVSDQAGRL